MTSRAALPRPLLLCSLAALGAICLTPSPSQACKKRHQTPFELYDLATSVAHVRVHAVPPPGATRNRPGPGDVRLDVLKRIKPIAATTAPAGAATGTGAPTGPGARPSASAPPSPAAAAGTASPSPRPAAAAAASSPQLISHVSGSDCDVPFVVGETAVIFLDAAGWPQGAHESYLRSVDSWQPVLEAWAAAKDAPARAAVLVAAATVVNPDVRREAALALVDDPALLAALDAAGRARLVKQLAAAPSNPATSVASELPLVLVRLRERAAITKLPRWMKLARAVGAVTRFETERDPAALAAAILAARKPADRWAAFERCERARATRLATFTRYIDDLDKVAPAALATSCRDGTALVF